MDVKFLLVAAFVHSVRVCMCATEMFFVSHAKKYWINLKWFVFTVEWFCYSFVTCDSISAFERVLSIRTIFIGFHLFFFYFVFVCTSVCVNSIFEENLSHGNNVEKCFIWHEIELNWHIKMLLLLLLLLSSFFAFDFIRLLFFQIYQTTLAQTQSNIQTQHNATDTQTQTHIHSQYDNADTEVAKRLTLECTITQTA